MRLIIYFRSDDGTTNTIAGVGTLILEFGRLSDITNDMKYARLARKAEEYILKPEPSSEEPYPGLLGSFVDVSNGKMADSSGSWGAYSDCE